MTARYVMHFPNLAIQSPTNYKTSSNNPLSIAAAIGSQDLADEQRSLLDLIAKLQYAQLDNVKLPQIVVVGDQSAGKSSVLEAITGTPFPRDAGACTRFATEIRLRRSNEESFSINIIPDRKHRSLAEQERLRQFGRNVDESAGFEALMKHAVEQIAPKGVPGRFASEDILVVEKQGPHMPLLTVVDLPGLVKNPNTDQSADDIRAINDLTDSYMKSPRTIILAVVGGNQDYVQAPVLTKAREFDTTGARTIGVLTKPDLTESIGLEDKFISLVNNNDRLNHFELGWYVLLNPGPREPGQRWPSPEERKQREDAFFLAGKWSALPPEMCGAAALKAKLSVQLQRHIGKHIKALRKDIQKALEECDAELKALGTGKDTVEEMRDEIVELFSESKDLVIPAVYGMYGMDISAQNKPFFPQTWNRRGTPPTNLRARAVEENKRFADRVRTHGHRVTFSSISDSQGRKARKSGNMTKQDFARMEVEPLLQQRAGTGFPMDHEPRLVYVLFQRFSDDWTKLAQQHKDNLGVICNEFLGEVIDHVWPSRMREPLRRKFLDPQIKAMLELAQSEVEKLLQDRNFEVQPYDPEYENRLIQWRTEASKEGPYTVAEEFLEKTLIYYEVSSLQKLYLLRY
jgi:GTPase SAR1 family protein